MATPSRTCASCTRTWPGGAHQSQEDCGPAEAGRADWAAGGGAGAWEGLLKGRAGTADGEGWETRKSVSRRQRRSWAV
ncbi:hypothetical protein D623_10010059 [Myotis brandtii]|uniref:Uncharacterized protein n=1 Tax=Myotis brandtii TaxID=109478 RepID=S7MHW5_MYOBR|nr:hypothetical protein D623_10010059 [Myotis brandtii]